MKINLKTIKENNSKADGEYTPLDEGRYDLVVEGGKIKTSAAKNEYLEIAFRVTGPKFANRKLWTPFMLSETGLYYLIRFLKAAGLEALTETDDLEIEEVIKAMSGQKVSGYVEIKNERNELSNFTPIGGKGNAEEPAAPAAKPVSAAPKKKMFS